MACCGWSETNRNKCRNVFTPGVVTVIGCMLALFSLGHGYIFSNVSPYLTSYLRNRSMSTDVAYKDTVWIPTSNIITSSVFMPIFGLLDQKIPSRICVLIGSWTFSLSIALTYFSVSRGFISTIFTYAVFYSMGKCLCYPVTNRIALAWFPKRVGMVSGLLEAAYAGSAFALNQIVTQFINPENLSPDQIVDNDDRYFTQSSLLDRVPYCFLVLGGLYFTVATIAVLLMTDPRCKAKQVSHGDPVSEEATADDIHVDTTTAATAAIDYSHDTPNTPDTVREVRVVRDVSNPRDIEEHDLSPMQTLKSPRFLVAWLMYFCFGVAMDLFFPLSKPYGQTFIQDDQFFSWLASISAIFSALGTLLWGYMTDKFTYKPVLMVLLAGFGMLMSTVTTTEYGGKPMIFIWFCLMNFCSTGFYVLIPVIALDMFGNTFYSVNFGLMHTAGIPFSFLSAAISSNLKDRIGYHGLFFICAGMIILSFIFSVVIFLNDWSVHSRKSKTGTRQLLK